MMFKILIFVNNINGDNMFLFKATLRTIFFYFYVVILYRIMGKREVAELGIVDLIVSILIANIVAISIENLDHNILESVIPILLLGLLEIGLAYINVKNKKVREFLCGKPSFIINNGKINHQEMIKQRYNLDDLLLELRSQEISNIKDVKYAILEANGKLSIFKYKNTKNNYPMPIIMDSKVIDESLKNLNKNHLWLNNSMKSKNIRLDNVFYAYFNKNTVYFILKKDLL